VADDAKADWVLRVLGVQTGSGAPDAKPFDEAAFKRDFTAAVTAWRSASEDVDGQINDMRKALLATNDADLHRIADTGLNGITGSRKVGLQKRLIDVGRASGDAIAPAALNAAKAAHAYRVFLQSDPRVAACDAYPKIKTPIGATLGKALGVLAKTLAI
jgi:hypothetical protein